jgi:hypothetical protein
VLLSKADLLSPANRQRLVDYTRELLRKELGLELLVHPVSTVGADEALLARWFEKEIGPLLERYRELTQASLRRKIAALRETVTAVLQTLRDRSGGVPAGAANDVGRMAKQLLDEADGAIRGAQARALDWTRGDHSFADVILRSAARAGVEASGGVNGAGDGPLLEAARQVLVERGRQAFQLASDLRAKLGQTLVRLAAPRLVSGIDPAAVRDLGLGGLPDADLSPLRAGGRAARPWWSALAPGLAAGALARSLRRRVGPALAQQVRGYDRQVQLWLRQALGRIAEAYETQAGVIREQVRRLTAGFGPAAAPDGDRQNLEADLRELQPATPPEPVSDR